MKYTIDYFIDKFKNIPSNKWCVGLYENNKDQCCALGHLGMHNGKYNAEEILAFCNIIELLDIPGKSNTLPDFINDGRDKRFKQKHPRSRILAALKLAKKLSGE